VGGGNYTALNIFSGAAATFAAGLASLTGTNTTLYGKGTLLDPGKRVTFTNPIAVKADLGSVTLNLGVNLNVQRS